MAQTPPDNRTDHHLSDSIGELQLEYDQKLRDAVAAFNRNRSVIEQAKGMLMFIYGIDADDAFRLLSAQSQAANVKVRLIAERLTVDFLTLTPEHRVAERSACDEVLFRDSPLGPSVQQPA